MHCNSFREWCRNDLRLSLRSKAARLKDGCSRRCLSLNQDIKVIFVPRQCKSLWPLFAKAMTAINAQRCGISLAGTRVYRVSSITCSHVICRLCVPHREVSVPYMCIALHNSSRARPTAMCTTKTSLSSRLIDRCSGPSIFGLARTAAVSPKFALVSPLLQ